MKRNNTREFLIFFFLNLSITSHYLEKLKFVNSMSASTNSIQIVLLRTVKEQTYKRWEGVSNRKKEIKKYTNKKTERKK